MATRQRTRRIVLFLILIALPITLNYYSVFLIVQSASEGVANFSFFFWVSFALTSLVIGRLACSWICPLGAVQETLDRMAELRLKRIKYLKVIKYVLAVAWVGAIVALAISAGGYHKVNLLYNTESGVSVDSSMSLIAYYTVLLVPFLPALFLGKRAFCHYFCPWGVLNTVGTKIKNLFRWPSLNLKADSSQCVNCKTCNRECTMSLDVNAMVQRGSMDNAECILCGSCVDNCKRGVIKYAWRREKAAGV